MLSVEHGLAEALAFIRRRHLRLAHVDASRRKDRLIASTLDGRILSLSYRNTSYIRFMFTERRSRPLSGK